MLFSTSLLTLLALSSTALASTHKPARQYRRELSPENSNVLIPRLDVDPTLVCGTSYVDCNNGWCCSEGAKCGTSGKVPICIDPSQSVLGGTIPALPFKSIEAAGSSLAAIGSSLLADLSTYGITVPTGTAASVTGTAKTTGPATGTAAAAGATGTGAANSNKLTAWGVAGAFGAGVMMVV